MAFAGSKYAFILTKVLESPSRIAAAAGSRTAPSQPSAAVANPTPPQTPPSGEGLYSRRHPTVRESPSEIAAAAGSRTAPSRPLPRFQIRPHSKLIPEGRSSNSAHPESESATRHKRLHFTASTRRKQGCAPQPRKFELPFHRSAGRSGTLPDTNRNTLHRQQRHLCTPDGDSSLLILNFVA